MLGWLDLTPPSADTTADDDCARGRERALRRSVGPTAWAVLADLWLDARCDGDGVVIVAGSARRLASNVGIGKDTAARALRRLSAAGVLRRRPQANDDAGRFGCCTYELHMESRPGAPHPRHPDTEACPCPVSVDTDDKRHDEANDAENERADGSSTGSRRASPRRNTRGRGATNQLSLLDASGDARPGAAP